MEALYFMKKPTLVIMAAGMGSRYGGLKQIDPMDEYGNVLMDFSVFDAVRAGFEDVVFIIKHAIEDDFKAAIGDRLSKHVNVSYAFQELSMLPDGFTVPEGRVKPWGTAHAVLCAKDVIHGPFAALNADDFYGAGAFKEVYDFLTTAHPDNEHAIVGYKVTETLTDFGSVSRGICEVRDGYLSDIHERTKVVKTEDGAAYTEDDGQTYIPIPRDATVSMNFWGFNDSFLDVLSESFPRFLKTAIVENPLKCEDYLPETVRRALGQGAIRVKLLTSPDRWHGVTHKDDKPQVVAAIKRLKEQGVYPERLWK